MAGGGAAGEQAGRRPASTLAVRLVAWLTVVASTPSRAPVTVTGRFRWARSRVAMRSPARSSLRFQPQARPVRVRGQPPVRA